MSKMKVSLIIYDSNKPKPTIEEHWISRLENRTLPTCEAKKIFKDGSVDKNNRYLILHAENDTTFIYKYSEVVDIQFKQELIRIDLTATKHRYIMNKTCKIVLLKNKKYTGKDIIEVYGDNGDKCYYIKFADDMEYSIPYSILSDDEFEFLRTKAYESKMLNMFADYVNSGKVKCAGRGK